MKLSKQDLALSQAEAEAVCGVNGILFDEFLLIETHKRNLQDILAYTKSVGEFGFLIRRYPELADVEPLVKGSYGLHFHHVKNKIKQRLLFYTTQLDHKVQLKNPTTALHFVQKGKQLLCYVNPRENVQAFEKRKPHLRPSLHPSSLHPRLARAFVNLTGIQQGVLFDPCCGSGGILIEAGLRGLQVVGSDISQPMINRAKINCKHYRVKADLAKQDALSITKKYNYIATDLAYGKSTVAGKDFITKFMMHLPTMLRKRAVIGLPSSYDEEPVLRKVRGLKVTHRFTYYLHKSLSKKILVIEKQ